ncbi:TPA: hypothetical protein QCR51_004365 [Bacillus cereus]|nr:hypothetical protein [Bacillus cereus]HDR4947811.1 hypothetical protein [Bacillus cereus]
MYCYACLITVLTTKFKSRGVFSESYGEILGLSTYDLDGDIEEGILWYRCKRVLEDGKLEELDEHDEIGEYLVQSKGCSE